MEDEVHLRASSDRSFDLLDLLALQQEEEQEPDTEARCRDGVVSTSRLLLSLCFPSLASLLETRREQEQQVILLPDTGVREVKTIFRAFLSGRWRLRWKKDLMPEQKTANVEASNGSKMSSKFTKKEVGCETTSFKACDIGRDLVQRLDPNMMKRSDTEIEISNFLHLTKMKNKEAKEILKNYALKNVIQNKNREIIKERPILLDQMKSKWAEAEHVNQYSEFSMMPNKAGKYEEGEVYQLDQLQTCSTNKEEPTMDKVYACLCGRTFKLFKEFTKHVNCVHEKDSMEHTHYNEVKEQRLLPTDLICSYCDVQFPTSVELKNHKNRYKGQNGRMICPEEGCVISYKPEGQNLNFNTGARTCRQLKKHMMEHRGLPKNFKCSDCVKVFFSQHDVQHHYNSVHRSKQFQCDECPQAFRMKSRLKIHIATHSNVRSFACEICGNMFKTKLYFKIHMSGHANISRHKCHICNTMFRNPENRRRHVKHVHEGIREYYCDKCSQQFKQQSHFKRHTMLHTDKRPFSCSKCQRGFIQKVNKNLHETNCKA